MPVDRRLDLEEITSPLSLVCKSCRKLFQKDLHIFGDDDLTCPHCENRFVIPGMTPESVLIRECTQAISVPRCARVSPRPSALFSDGQKNQAMKDATLDAPLRLEVDMALQFEHLVDYSRLPPSLDPNYESKLDALLHRRIASREATPMLLATEDMSRPETRGSFVDAPPPHHPPSPTPPSTAGAPGSRGGAA